MEREDYEVVWLGKYFEDSEEEAYDKYKHLIYYYRAEEFDRMVCGLDGTPKNPWEYKAVRSNAENLWLNIRPSGNYKRSYCHMNIKELCKNIEWYNEKYKFFSEWIERDIGNNIFRRKYGRY